MYGNHRSHVGTEQLLTSGADPAPKTGDMVETFAIGTIFPTPSGPVAIELLRVGDQIIDENGTLRTILWMREDRNVVVGADNVAHLDSPGRQTRFPGVRFVRGRRAGTAYQVILGDVAAAMPRPQAPVQPQPTAQPQAEYVAEFSSSRSRTHEDDADTQLAAE